jgi:predicted DNA-binding protein with PD1-like motif
MLAPFALHHCTSAAKTLYTRIVNVAVSTRSRRLVGRLDRGADLLPQLVAICRAHAVRAGELRAVGALEDVVVGEWDQQARAARPPRHFAAQFEILTLTATIGERDGAPSLSPFVSLSRARDNGIELIGGRLVAGRVFACEFVIDAFDDVALPATLDAATGLHLWAPARPPIAAVPDAPPLAPDVTPAPEPEPQPFEAPARTSWSDVIAASERRVEADTSADAAEPMSDEELDAATAPDVQVRPGDLIDHPKFGRVQVERVDGDHEFVSARLRNQRLIRLSLEVLTLIPAGQAEGRNLFRAVAGGGR